MKKPKPKTMTEAMIQLENENQPTLLEELESIKGSLFAIRRRIDRMEQSIYGHIIQE